MRNVLMFCGILLPACTSLPLGLHAPPDASEEEASARPVEAAAADVRPVFPSAELDAVPLEGEAASAVLDAGVHSELDASVEVPDSPRDSAAAGESAAPSGSDAPTDAAGDSATGVAVLSSPHHDGDVPCQPANCGTHSWACWPMPNGAAPGLPNRAR